MRGERDRQGGISGTRARWYMPLGSGVVDGICALCSWNVAEVIKAYGYPVSWIACRRLVITA